MQPEQVAIAGMQKTTIIHLIHYVGFAMALGGSLAAMVLANLRKGHEAPAKKGIEEAIKNILVKVEIPGLFLAFIGGILALVWFPDHIKPRSSGAGPWLHFKIPMVLAVLVISHLRMFKAAKTVRERAAGATEDELDGLADKSAKFGKIDLALLAAIFGIAIFRYSIWA